VFVLALGLALAAADVGIRVEEHEELSLETALHLSESLGRAIEARSGRTFVIDDFVWERCRAEDRCLNEARARTGAADIVLVKMFGAPKKIRLIAQRFGKEATRAEINVPIESNAWGAPLEEVARLLFPNDRRVEPKKPEEAAVVPLKPLPPPDEVSHAPWVLIGAGATALIVGSVFGVSSRMARHSAENEALSDLEFADSRDRIKAHGWTANILWPVGLLSAGAGAYLLFLE
jgi:hypothetical protein